MSTRYGTLAAGRYLKERFGFEFVDTDQPGLNAVQDALFAHAGEIQRLRAGLLKTIRSLTEDLVYIRKSLTEGGNVYTPIGDSARPDPVAPANRIEREERSLQVWVQAVRTLQDSLGVS